MDIKHYKKVSIYKLVSSNGLNYIGSSTKLLTDRLSYYEKHNAKYKYKYKYHKIRICPAYKLFENNAKVIIELLEDCTNIMYDDLITKKKYYINLYDCVNKPHEQVEPIIEQVEPIIEQVEPIIEQVVPKELIKVKPMIKFYKNKKEHDKILGINKLLICSSDIYDVIDDDKFMKLEKGKTLCIKCNCKFNASDISRHRKTEKHKINRYLSL